MLVEYDLDNSSFDNHLVIAKRYKLEDTAIPTAILPCQPGSEQVLLMVIFNVFFYPIVWPHMPVW
jgi:hypothetical protein